MLMKTSVWVSEGSVARGLALLAWLTMMVVAWRLLGGPSVEPAGHVPPPCPHPVEVAKDEQTWLACSSDVALTICGSLRAGDRVVLVDTSCRVVPGGMRAALRLLYDLALDVNRASAEELALLRGVGPATAGAIVAFRRERGPFQRLDDLLDVRGIGPVTLKKISPYLEIAASDRHPFAPSTGGRTRP